MTTETPIRYQRPHVVPGAGDRAMWRIERSRRGALRGRQIARSDAGTGYALTARTAAQLERHRARRRRARHRPV